MNDKATTEHLHAPGAPSGTAINPLLTVMRLSDLRFGHEKDVNSRQDPRDLPAWKDSVAAMKASIEEVGIIVPLCVTRLESGTFVIDGNTRLEALRQIYAKKDWPTVQVPTFEPPADGGPASSLELSLIANVERTDLHPVDQFEVFSKLIQAGATIEQLGRRYMMKPAQVRQALALSGLHPDVRKAWRAGIVTDETAEIFAMTQDLEHQARVLKKVGKRAGEHWPVKEQIVGGHDEFSVDVMLKFVGKGSYEAAGHQINESLFRDEERFETTMVNNVPALRAMTQAKIDAECTRLVEDGWNWAIPRKKAPNDIYSWRRLPDAKPSKDLKASAGCTVTIGHDGKLQVERGYIKPGVSVKIPKSPAEKAKATKAAAEKRDAGGLSQSLCFRLSQAITLAAAKTIAADPSLALRAVVAAMICSATPLRIDIQGHDAEAGESRHDKDPAKVLAQVLKCTDKDLLEELAIWAGAAMQMVAHSPQSMPLFAGKDADEDQKAAAVLLNAMNVDRLNSNLRQEFDRKDYFSSVSADLIRQALIDCGGLDLASGCSTMKKAGKIAYALEKVPPQWLPPEMRTMHYDGPMMASTKANNPDRAKKSPTKAKAKQKKGGKR